MTLADAHKTVEAQTNAGENAGANIQIQTQKQWKPKAKTPQEKRARIQSFTLLYAALIAGLCSIIYELLIATTASYFLGDSVRYFSLTIGLYMASMGAGSFVSKYIDDDLLPRFIQMELWLGLIGGLSIPVLYFAYAYFDALIPFYVLFTITIGFLIGLEIPFLTRLMQDYHQLKFNIAHILSFDYLGALIATVSFPFLLLPFFGVYQSSLIFGLVNMSIGFVVLWVFADVIGKDTKKLKLITIITTTVLAGMIVYASKVLEHWDQRLYRDRIIESQQSPYQKLVLTKHKDDIRLYLDGNLQFSSVDEHRYHESLIHVPLSLHGQPVRRVLLLGAGDGLAVRELLKYPKIEEIILVDLDPQVIQLARHNHYLTALNQNSLDSPKVKIVVSDAYTYIKENNQAFDFIVSDLPDPNHQALARLYSQQFYRLLRSRLAENGVFVTQATSPYFATKAFWSIEKTIRASGFGHVYPYHTHVPSFGDWGFVMASAQEMEIEQPHILPSLDANTAFLNRELFPRLFIFEKDLRVADIKVNRLDKPVLLTYYLEGWVYGN